MSEPRSDWVRDLAYAVRGLVRQFGCEPFRAKVRQWKTDWDAAPRTQPPPIQVPYGPPDEKGNPTLKLVPAMAHGPDFPLLRSVDPLSEPAPKTLPEKYAVLSVIHDALCVEAEPIDPWRQYADLQLDGQTLSSPERFGAFKAGLAAGAGYWSMVADVRRGCLRGCDGENDLRRELQAVLEDLRTHLGKPPAPLTDHAAAVLELLRTLPPHRGLTGPAIMDQLNNQGMNFDQSTLTTRIIPALKPYGVRNKPKVGYYIDPSEVKTAR